jgi:hypothetical protein
MMSIREDFERLVAPTIKEHRQAEAEETRQGSVRRPARRAAPYRRVFSNRRASNVPFNTIQFGLVSGAISVMLIPSPTERRAHSIEQTVAQKLQMY